MPANWMINTTTTATPFYQYDYSRGMYTYSDVNVAPPAPPGPLERLAAEVEKVCARARAQ